MSKKTQREETDRMMKQLSAFVEEMKRALGVPIIPDMKTGKALWYDVRELKLRYLISIDKIREFFNALADDKILATKCKDCGTVYFPPQIDCPKCKDSQVEWVEMSRNGKLLTYTVIYVKPDTFAHYDDYIVGIAELDDGVKVTAWVREKDPTKLKVGQRVKIEIVKREPEGYLTYEIVPIK